MEAGTDHTGGRAWFDPIICRKITHSGQTSSTHTVGVLVPSQWPPNTPKPGIGGPQTQTSPEASVPSRPSPLSNPRRNHAHRYPSRLGPLRRRWSPLVHGLQCRQPGPGPGLLGGRGLLGVDVLLVLVGCRLLQGERRRARLAGRRGAQHHCSEAAAGSACGAKQRALAPADRPRRGTLPPWAPASARPARPGWPRAEEAAEAQARPGWAARDTPRRSELPAGAAAVQAVQVSRDY